MNTGYQAKSNQMASYFIFTKGDGWYCTMFENQEYGPFVAYRDAEIHVRHVMASQRLREVA